MLTFVVTNIMQIKIMVRHYDRHKRTMTRKKQTITSVKEDLGKKNRHLHSATGSIILVNHFDKLFVSLY